MRRGGLLRHLLPSPGQLRVRPLGELLGLLEEVVVLFAPLPLLEKPLSLLDALVRVLYRLIERELGRQHDVRLQR